jgi:hypothetical protein
MPSLQELGVFYLIFPTFGNLIQYRGPPDQGTEILKAGTSSR